MSVHQLHPHKAPFDPATAKTTYILVRTDLSLVQQGVQACHAGMQAVARFGGLEDDTRLALLSVANAQELSEWQERLERKGIAFTTFWEPDHNTGESALATPPLSRQEGKVFARLPLWQPGGLAEAAQATG